MRKMLVEITAKETFIFLLKDRQICNVLPWVRGKDRLLFGSTLIRPLRGHLALNLVE